MVHLNLSPEHLYYIVSIIFVITSIIGGIIGAVKKTIINPIIERSDEQHQETLAALNRMSDKMEKHQDILTTQNERINQLRREANDHENRLRKIENVESFPNIGDECKRELEVDN